MESCGLCGSRLLVHGDCINCMPLGRSRTQSPSAVSQLRPVLPAVVTNEPSPGILWIAGASAAPTRESATATT